MNVSWKASTCARDGRLETRVDDPRVACVRERLLEARLLGVEDEVPVDVDLVRLGWMPWPASLS